MDEEETKVCDNCKRDIPVVNYTIHSVHCVRNLRLCPVCKEPIPANLLEQHYDTLHKPSPCKQCGESVCGTDMEDHVRDSCGHTVKSCRYCELELPRRDLPAHESYCGTRTEQCSDCKEWVMIKYRQIHLQSNHGFLRLDDDPVPPQAKPGPPKAASSPKPTRPANLNMQHLINPTNGVRTEIRYFENPVRNTTQENQPKNFNSENNVKTQSLHPYNTADTATSAHPYASTSSSQLCQVSTSTMQALGNSKPYSSSSSSYQSLDSSPIKFNDTSNSNSNEDAKAKPQAPSNVPKTQNSAMIVPNSQNKIYNTDQDLAKWGIKHNAGPSNLTGDQNRHSSGQNSSIQTGDQNRAILSGQNSSVQTGVQNRAILSGQNNSVQTGGQNRQNSSSHSHSNHTVDQSRPISSRHSHSNSIVDQNRPNSNPHSHSNQIVDQNRPISSRHSHSNQTVDQRPISSGISKVDQTPGSSVQSCSNPVVDQRSHSTANGAHRLPKRTNEQQQVNNAANAHKLRNMQPPRGGAIKKRPAPRPPREPPQDTPERRSALISALQRQHAEQAQREEQNLYNAQHGLPPVLTAAQKLEKLRKMDALHNRETVDESWRNKLRGRVWMERDLYPAGNVLGSNPTPEPELTVEEALKLRREIRAQLANGAPPIGDVLYSDPDVELTVEQALQIHRERKARRANGGLPPVRNDLQNLQPMSPEQFEERFHRMQLEGSPQRADRAPDRINEIKNSLHALRRGLNEDTANMRAVASNISRLQIEVAPERPRRAPDRTRRASERARRTPERARRASERARRAPERARRPPDRYDEIKNSLHALRRGLNEVRLAQDSYPAVGSNKELYETRTGPSRMAQGEEAVPCSGIKQRAV